MGADLIVSIIPFPRFESGEYVSDFDMIRDEVRDRIQNRTVIFMDAYGIVGEEEAKEYADGFDGNFVEMCLSLTEQYFLYAIDGRSRDIATLYVPCGACGEISNYLLTGGMSWGESPTESFDISYAIEYSGIFDERFSSDYRSQ